MTGHAEDRVPEGREFSVGVFASTTEDCCLCAIAETAGKGSNEKETSKAVRCRLHRSLRRKVSVRFTVGG